MTCGHCTSSVEQALGELPGVDSVIADLESGNVTIAHLETIDTNTFTTAIEQIGFEVDLARL